jgi:hypothetical protein
MGISIGIIAASGSGIEVPNLVGLTQTAANAAIVAAGLTVGTVTVELTYDINLDETVKSQNPLSGTQVELGTAVSYVKYDYTPAPPYFPPFFPYFPPYFPYFPYFPFFPYFPPFFPYFPFFPFFPPRFGPFFPPKFTPFFPSFNFFFV